MIAAATLRFRRTALDAYAVGFPGATGWQAPSSYIARALTIASSLQAAADLAPGAERDAILARSRAAATELLGGGVMAESWVDPVGVDSPTTAFRALAQALNLRDQYAVAGHIIESLHLMSEPGSMEQGRVFMQLASQAALAGDVDLLFGQARALFALGRELGSDELLCKAWIQFNAYRHMRGNFPAWRVAVRHMMKYAERLGDPRLMSLALNMRMSTRGQEGDFGGSVADGWRGLELCDHPDIRTRLLTNLGEALNRSGHFRAARAARAIIFDSPTEISVLLSVLGGYAESCAGLGDRDGVRWATDQGLALTAAGTRLCRGIAQGLMSCADAAAAAGFPDLAHEAFARSMRIAESCGYHDLRFHTEPKARPVTRDAARPFSGSAEQARQSIQDLAPDGVPLTLVLAEA